MATLRIPLADTVDVVIDVNFIVVDVVVVDVTVVDAVLVADVIVIDSFVVADVIVINRVIVVAEVIVVDAVFVADVIVVDAVYVADVIVVDAVYVAMSLSLMPSMLLMSLSLKLSLSLFLSSPADVVAVAALSLPLADKVDVVVDRLAAVDVLPLPDVLPRVPHHNTVLCCVCGRLVTDPTRIVAVRAAVTPHPGALRGTVSEANESFPTVG